MAKLMIFIHDKPLQPPVAHEIRLIEELRNRVKDLPVPQLQCETESETQWTKNILRLRELILGDDPRRFLRWDVIKKTMFMGYPDYIQTELKYLKTLPDWKSRRRIAVAESTVGHPLPYPFYPHSSGNLIHHAYHIAQFEEKIGKRIDTMNTIFEFGGGYGSMCRLAHHLGFKGKYIIFDFPHFSELQRYYLNSSGINVTDKESFLHSDSGTVCISDIDELFQLIKMIDRNSAMFIATWSISEAPLDFRESILNLVKEFQFFNIAFQSRFKEIDNFTFFKKWSDSMGDQILWKRWKIDQIKGNNYYLMGKRNDNG